MTSLRARAVTAGVLWAAVAVILGLTALSSYLTAQSEARFVELLETRHTQVLVSVANNAGNPENFGRAIGDPVYQRPFSGVYWQIEGDDGALYTSPSLVEALLPAHETNSDAKMIQEVVWEDDERLLCITQSLTMDDGAQWRVQVAMSLATLEQERAVLRQSLLWAFVIATAVAIAGAWLQVTAVLRPLNVLRRDVAERWQKEEGLKVSGYPVEVAPLVSDINGLMQRNHEIIRASRKQAADLAHAIKTPAAIMRNEFEQLQSDGRKVDEALYALDRLDAQLQRSLARIRADASEGAVGAVTALDTALGRMDRAFSALARNAGKSFEASYDADLRVRMDQNDFEEVIGNLLDNAMKWAASRFVLSAARTDGDAVLITIADDGPGIPDAQLRAAMVSGQRLDESKPGTGLGLAIAADLVHIYGGKIVLARSEELGGLAVHIRLPVPGRGHIADETTED